MADVLKIAHERRAELRAEIAKLDEFIRMGEALIRYSRANSARAEANAAPKPEVRTTAVKRPASVPSRDTSERAAEPRNDDQKKSADVARPTIIRQGNAAS